MEKYYNGIKYYSDSDMSIGESLKKAAEKLDSFDETKEYTDINEVIELYNIKELFDSGVKLTDWDSETYNAYKKKCSSFMKLIKGFFDKITDYSFNAEYDKVDLFYKEDFWDLFERLKVFNNVSKEIFKKFLGMPETTLYKILEHKEIVHYYDSEVTDIMRLSDQTAEIIIDKFLKKETSNYYFPKGLDVKEFENILQKYVDSDHPNANRLKYIYESKSTGECPISDKLKLSAKHKYEEFWKNNKDASVYVEYSVEIQFQKQSEIVKASLDGTICKYSYDISWFEENLDYATILNNFINVFGLFDLFSRCEFVSVKSQMGALERVFTANSKNGYEYGQAFVINDMRVSAQVNAYYHFLLEKGIRLEEVFKWFFEEYLVYEFNVNGFILNIPRSDSAITDKCRSLASEMDGVLKQFRMFVQEGNIDRELFELSSEQMIIKDIPSLIPHKYAYPNNEDIQRTFFELFSDQSLLSYTEKTEDKYDTLFDMLIKCSNMQLSDFANYQQTHINWLLNKGYLYVSEDNYIRMNQSKVVVLRDIYKHDVTCIQYYNKNINTLKDWLNTGDIRVGSTLFSVPEANYINYKLNKKEYSNGLDLRNKYIHGNYSQDENIQHRDYIEFLKIMIIVITKINEEFCLRDHIKNLDDFE